MHWSRSTSCYSVATTVTAVGLSTYCFTVAKPVTEWWWWDGFGGILLKAVWQYCTHSYGFCFEKSGDHVLSSCYCCQLWYNCKLSPGGLLLKLFETDTQLLCAFKMDLLFMFGLKRCHGETWHKCLNWYGWPGHVWTYFSAELPKLALSASVFHMLLFPDWIAIRLRPF